MNVILNGDQIFAEELIRENARLTVRHEADLQVINGLSDRVEQLEAEAVEITNQEVFKAQDRVKSAEAVMAKATEDLHFVMAGGDPCKVCTVKCLMGEGNCKPVWRGEEAGQ